MTSLNYWGSTDMVFQCLIDEKRTNTFKKVILDTVRKGDVVVDLGSGSGILSMFAVEAGASKVYAVESDEEVAKVLEFNLEKNGYKSVVTLLKSDATSVVLPEKVDVVISEMVATGLIDELQIPVMNNINLYLKNDAKVIPMIIENYIELVNIDNNFYGKSIETIQYEYEWDNRKRPIGMTNKYMYKDINFTKKNNNVINEKIVLKALQAGPINGLRFSNKTLFSNGSALEGTAAYCMPLIFPLEEFEVKANDILTVELNYIMCTGMQNLEFKVKKESTTER